ncbi:hypothetical protein LIER_12283 [Lithospermum erythrorhizon]|uniref:NAC domain-containing protein n=1 Tax=Lithospermum erythrorhizon TaxID=34254 RepID=A0AAV3PT15_LITER
MSLRRGIDGFFFTPLYRKYPFGGRPNRGTNESGYWKATSPSKMIYHPHNKNRVLGYRKSLIYFFGRSPEGVENVRSNWRMHEYSIKKTSTTNRDHKDDMRLQLDDWVLCKIFIQTHAKCHRSTSINYPTSRT